MSLPTSIQGYNGSKGDLVEAHVHQRNGTKGLAVYTQELKQNVIKFQPAVNETHGIEMAINAAFGGTPDIVHNGTDTTVWTGSNISGTKVTFNSTDQAQAGTKSVKVNKAVVGNVWQFDKGSNLTISSYAALTLYIYVGSGWTVGNSVNLYAWDTGSATQVGDFILLEDYFNELSFGGWQQLSIPFSDLNISTGTFDALRMEILTKNGAGILFYIDTFQVEETSASATFKVEPPVGKKFFISRFNFTIQDAYAGTLTDGTMTNLSYDKFLNQTLTNGLNFTLIQGGEVNFSSAIKSVGDSFKGGGKLINPISDGTNASITLSTKFDEPTVLDSRTGDCISVTVSENLTGLISLTAIAMGKTQDI